jgi:hypothetical protein
MSVVIKAKQVSREYRFSKMRIFNNTVKRCNFDVETEAQLHTRPSKDLSGSQAYKDARFRANSVTIGNVNTAVARSRCAPCAMRHDFETCKLGAHDYDWLAFLFVGLSS